MSNRVKKSGKRTQPGPRAACRAINRVLESTGNTISQLARAAVDWWKQQHGRRIKTSAIREVVRAFDRGYLNPPSWLMTFLNKGPYASHVAA